MMFTILSFNEATLIFATNHIAINRESVLNLKEENSTFLLYQISTEKSNLCKLFDIEKFNDNQEKKKIK